MNDTSVTQPTTKRADQLARGDWLAAGELTPDPAEILFAEPFTYDAGPEVHLVFRRLGIAQPFTDTIGAGAEFVLATEAELAVWRESGRRAEFIADVRAFANVLEDNPWLPLPYHVRGQVGMHDGAASVAKVRELAERLGLKVDESLDDRTGFNLEIGRHAELTVLAWHEGGRPAEPAPEPAERPHCSKACKDLYRPDRGVHFLGCPNFSTPMEVAQPEDLGDDFDRSQTADVDTTPVPVHGRRHEPHNGGVVSGIAEDGTREGEPSQPVDETEAVGEHHHVGGSFGGPGENGAECACGVVFDGFDTPAEANAQLDGHIEAATSPTGLTKAADESRGVLAFTASVVTYFSFGHGQTDPGTGKSLLDHYVTVVAPTYEACREAMFASRFGREWSFDYLAGTARATHWIPRWTEHEVIVAPGLTPAEADQALAAALNVLDS